MKTMNLLALLALVIITSTAQEARAQANGYEADTSRGVLFRVSPGWTWDGGEPEGDEGDEGNVSRGVLFMLPNAWPWEGSDSN